LTEFGVVENFGNQTNAGNGLKDVIVDGYNTSTFLTTVLKSVESDITETRSFWIAVDTNNAAFFTRLFVVVIINIKVVVVVVVAWS
jgi:hypothetical protein